MSEAREPLRRVVVAGDGQVGVLAALAVKRALPSCDVAVLSTPPDPASFADRAGTALPFSNRLHARLGSAEEDIVRSAGGSYRLVTRLIGWGADGQAGCLAYGMVDGAAPGEDFGRRWGGGSRSDAASASPGSLAELLAANGRFAVPPDVAPSPLQGVDYAMRWNPGAYRELLVARAQAAGVQYVSAGLADAERAGSGIATLVLGDGARLEADLFLDCTGPGALLASRLDAFEREDWSAHLPTRHVGFAQPGEPLLALEDRVQLTENGFVAQSAGRDALHVLQGFFGDAAPEGCVPLVPGALAQGWIGNVVAIGDAAAQFEPLGDFHLDLAHRQIDLVLELLPGRAIEPLERAEYNRRARLMADRVRDTLGLFYAAPRAVAMLGELKRSDVLVRWLDQYQRRSRLPFAEEAPLLTGELRSLMTALGFSGGSGALGRAQQAGGDDFARRADAALRATPPYAEWLRSVVQSA